MKIKINEQFFEQFLLSNGDKFFQVIKDKSGNVLFPKDSNKIELREKILSGNKDYYGRYNLNDSVKSYSMSEKPLLIDDETVYIETFIDETANKKVQYELQIDYLTKLKNRQLTLESSKEYIKEAIQLKKGFALVMFDVDYFKSINDKYGHDVGDKVLAKLGEYFRDHTRQGQYRNVDIVGRIGGEEFLILLKDISLENAVKKVQELQSNFKKEVTIDHEGVTISCGMCHFDANEYNYDQLNDVDSLLSELMKKCDKALYYSKKQGRDFASMYNPMLDDEEPLLKKHVIPIKKNL